MKLLKHRFEAVFSRQTVSSNSLEILKIMEWIPIVLVTFKVLVFGTGMFFAIKWHYDKAKKEKEKKSGLTQNAPNSSQHESQANKGSR